MHAVDTLVTFGHLLDCMSQAAIQSSCRCKAPILLHTSTFDQLHKSLKRIFVHYTTAFLQENRTFWRGSDSIKDLLHKAQHSLICTSASSHSPKTGICQIGNCELSVGVSADGCLSLWDELAPPSPRDGWLWLLLSAGHAVIENGWVGV